MATTDVLVAGVHFRLDWSTPEQVGRKAAAANLADVAAMGAVPTALLVGLAAPPDTPVATRRRAGRRPLGRGGGGRRGPGRRRRRDVGRRSSSRSPRSGRCEGRAPVTRSGARPGDVVALAGRLGLGRRRARGAAAGLPVARCGGGGAPGAGAAVRGGPGGRGAGATAMIDVSDGLLADLGARRGGVRRRDRRAPPEVPQKLLEVGAALGVDPVSLAAHRRRGPRAGRDVPAPTSRSRRASRRSGRCGPGTPPCSSRAGRTTATPAGPTSALAEPSGRPSSPAPAWPAAR